MKKFTISFERETVISQVLDVEIEASSKRAAKEYAKKMLENRDPRLLTYGWDDIDETRGDIVVGDISETEE